MTVLQRRLLSLVRLSLFDFSVEPSLFAGMQAKEWNELMDYAFDQGVMGLTFDAVEQLPSDSRPKLDGLMEWYGQTTLPENDNRLYQQTIQHLAHFYQK